MHRVEQGLTVVLLGQLESIWRSLITYKYLTARIPDTAYAVSLDITVIVAPIQILIVALWQAECGVLILFVICGHAAGGCARRQDWIEVTPDPTFAHSRSIRSDSDV